MLAVLGLIARVLQAPPTSGGGGNVPQPTPDPSGVPGQGAIETILDVLSWMGVAACVAGVILGGGLLAISNMTANSMYGSRGKTAVAAGLGGGLIVALAGQLVSFVVGLG